jgi:hypothetical protein
MASKKPPSLSLWLTEGKMAADIDPVRYGVLWQKVEDYERRFDQMDKKMDKMERQLEQLVGLANQGKGGFWAGMALVSAVSSAVGYVTHWFNKA